jgi:hypothetical protein
MATFAEKKFQQLDKAIKWSSRQLQFARKKRIEAAKLQAGFHYAENGSAKREPVNTIALGASIYARLLAPKAPRAMMSTVDKSFMPTAANFELAVNEIPEEIMLENTFRRGVLEALFFMGVFKVGLHTVGTQMGHEYGRSFVDLITGDDYFCDMAAKSWETIDYEGNDYWLDYEEVMESSWLDKSSAGNLKADEYSVIGQEGEQRAENMSSSETPTLYKEKIWCRDAWLPGENILVTYGVKSEKVLHVTEWDEELNYGPYYKLGYGEVVGNLLPLPPVALWRDLHELGNEVFRKLGDGAKSQKKVLGFGGNDDQAVDDFKKAGDGEGVKWTGTEPKELKAGGIDPTSLAFYLQTRDLASYFMGNLDSLGGLGLMAQTVGQEKLLGEAAGAQLRDMADRTVSCMKGVFKALAYYEWTDPIKERTLQKPIPGVEDSIPVEWNRNAKKGKFGQYHLKIDIYSLQDDSPQLLLAKLLAFVERVVVPMAPLIQQGGGTVDAEKIIKAAAKYSGLPPDVIDIVMFPEQAAEPAAGGGNMSLPMPSNTTRTYNRVGRPGMTRQGSTAAMTQLLMGGDPGGASPQGSGS